MKGLKIVIAMNVVICNSLMVCKRMIGEVFIAIYRKKLVFAREFENSLAISAPNVVESSRFFNLGVNGNFLDIFI
jgi:N-acyl-L-homoserine lactone synthetase